MEKGEKASERASRVGTRLGANRSLLSHRTPILIRTRNMQAGWMPASSPAGTTGRYDACNLFLLPPIFFSTPRSAPTNFEEVVPPREPEKILPAERRPCNASTSLPDRLRLRKFVRSIGRRRLRHEEYSAIRIDRRTIRRPILRSVDPDEPRLNSRTDLCLVLPCTELQRVRGKIITLDRTRW